LNQLQLSLGERCAGSERSQEGEIGMM